MFDIVLNESLVADMDSIARWSGMFWLTLGWCHCTKNEVFHEDFFSKCDQIRKKMRIWSRLLKKSLMKNLFLCAVYST